MPASPFAKEVLIRCFPELSGFDYIGAGTFKTVYRVTLADGQEEVLKIIRIPMDQSSDEAKQIHDQELGRAKRETRLLEAAGGCHFLSRRFDRGPAGARLHLHSYSGLTHTPLRDGLDYEDLMETTRSLTSDHRCVEEVFRRAVFNVVAANDDDHGRNHAFLMDSAGQWTLAPAFDLTLASYPLASGFRAARVNGKASQINRRDFLQLAAKHDVRHPGEIIDQVLDAVTRWDDHAVANGISG